MSQPSNGDHPEPKLLRQFDAICDAFEADWKNHQRPKLADFLHSTSIEQQSGLLRMLLPLDWEYRCKAGETPRVDEYQAQWPEFAQLIEDVLAAASTYRTTAGSIGPQDAAPLRDKSLESTITVSTQPARQNTVPESQFGEYTLVRELGRGGMAVVYLARHARLGRFVALKVIRSGEFAGTDEIQRFKAEAAAAAQLDHPGIVPVFEASTHRGQHFLTMAYVEGESLWHRIKERPLEPNDAARLIRSVAEAIQHAHERGVVHRDLKPQNIMLTADGQPRVTDFGLAKSTTSDARLTATGDVLGTPGFMPPEQASGLVDQIGPAADIYSLGATLYCVVTGRPPFQAANLWDTLRLVCDQDPVPPRALNPTISRDLETICLKCLRKVPLLRYATAAELAADLERFLTGKPILARPTGNLERGWRWCRRNPLVAGLSAVAVALLITITAVSTWAYRRQTFLTSEMATLAENEKSQRERAELQLHYSQVARGVTALDAGNFTGAATALDDTSQLEVRGWEYRYLKRKMAGTPLTLRGSAYPLLHVAYSSDGSQLATASLVGEVAVWGMSDGQKRHALKLATGSIRNLHFHPRRNELIGVSSQGAVTIWNLDTAQPRITWQAHAASVGKSDLSGDGTALATCSADGTVKIWDVETGSERLTFRGHTQPVSCVAFGPDGKSMVSGTSTESKKCELLVWNTETGKIIESVPSKFWVINDVCFNPEGTLIASTTGAGVSLWDVQLKKLPAVVLGHPEAVTSAAFSPSGALISTTSLDGLVRIWDSSTGKVLNSYGHHAQPVRDAAFSRDGYQLASVSGTLKMRGEGGSYSAGELKVWNIRLPEQDSHIAVDERNVDPETNYLNAVDFQPGTTVVATGGWRGKIRLVDVASGDDISSPVNFGSVIVDLKFHPHLPILAIAGTTRGPHGGLALYDLQTKAFTPLRGHSGRYVSFELSPRGDVLASVSEDNVIKLWNAETGQELGTLTGHSAPVTSYFFSMDGRRLVSRARIQGGEDEVKVWDVAQRRELKGTATSDAQGILSPDGRLRASRTPSGEVQVWNAIDGSLQQTLRGHLDAVPGLAFTPDGKRLITASRDRTVRVWDPLEGTELFRLSLAPDSANDVSISGDGSILACATQAGTVQIWDARNLGDNLRLKGHAASIEAYGFTSDGRLLSRDTNAETIQWSLPEGTRQANVTDEDPVPLPAVSPQGDWTVELDPKDPSILVATNRRQDVLPYLPWEESYARYRRLAPTWHAEDAHAAEQRNDWFAAAFHLSAQLEFSEDAGIRGRLQQARLKLDQVNRPAQ